MRIQILAATMYQNDFSLLERLNIQSEAVVVNQCDKEGIHSFEYNGYPVLWVDSTERGLSRSRNMALKNASADICVICDDDERLADGYPLMIENAYRALPKADFLAFNINRIGWNETERIFVKPKPIGRFRTYSSVHITFRRRKILENGIVFDVRFGAGSGMYACAEDAIFCMDCHRAGLGMYTYPGLLCDVVCEESTWFTGYDEKYFYDVGAYLAAAFPRLKSLLKWYYPLRCRKLTKLKTLSLLSAINKGIDGYKKGLNFKEFHDSVITSSQE